MIQYIDEALDAMKVAASRLHRALTERERQGFPLTTGVPLLNAVVGMEKAVEGLHAARAAAVTFERERYEATHAQPGPDGEKVNAG